MASAESKAAFGKAALFVEKFLEKIRHIEFQLVAKKDRQKDFCATEPLAT